MLPRKITSHLFWNFMESFLFGLLIWKEDRLVYSNSLIKKILPLSVPLTQKTTLEDFLAYFPEKLIQKKIPRHCPKKEKKWRSSVYFIEFSAYSGNGLFSFPDSYDRPRNHQDHRIPETSAREQAIMKESLEILILSSDYVS